MDDAEYIYIKEINERKRTSRGARAKRIGSKSKKCSLPSDHLSKKQLKELNGEMLTYNPKELTWEEFKKLPSATQKSVINIYKSYGARSCDVADFLGASAKTFSMYIQNHVPDAGWGKFNGKKSVDPRWTGYISFFNEAELKEVEERKKEPIAEAPTAETLEKPCACISEGTLTYTGEPETVFSAIKSLLGAGKFELTISFKAVSDD